MKLYYITFRSVTFAQRGEKLLGSMGIRCSLQRTPRWMEEQGCGYALRIWAQNVYPLLDQLRSNRIKLKKVYLQNDDGELEELQQ